MEPSILKMLESVKTDREKNLILVMVATDEDQTAIRLFVESLLQK
jgi:hypothetical protein